MDISTGRCPKKKQGCDCKRVCAHLYGQKVRELRKAVMESPANQLIFLTNNLNKFVDTFQKRI